MPVSTPVVHFLHVLAALWLATGILGSLLAAWVAKGEGPQAGAAVRLLWLFHMAFTLPGVVVGGFLGFMLVTVGGWGFAGRWVGWSSLLYLFLFLSSLFGLTPAVSRLRRVSRSRPEGLMPVLRQLPWQLASWLDAALLVALVYLMTVKP